MEIKVKRVGNQSWVEIIIIKRRTEGGTTWPCHASMTTLRVGKRIKPGGKWET